MDSVLEILEVGGPVLGALLVLAGLFGAFAFYRILSSWRVLRAAGKGGALEGHTSWEPARRLREALERGGPGALDRTLQAEGRRLRSGLSFLGALVSAAPLLGLLGTVDGMTRAFLALALSGGGADPALLGEGISRALVTTLAGLVVAVPGLLVHSGLESLAQAQEKLLALLGKEMAQDFQGRAAREGNR